MSQPEPVPFLHSARSLPCITPGHDDGPVAAGLPLRSELARGVHAPSVPESHHNDSTTAIVWAIAARLLGFGALLAAFAFVLYGWCLR